jgi:hypothetical protein
MPPEEKAPTVARKWKMNARKVSFAKSFPGCLDGWHDAVGKKIEEVVVLEKEKAEVVIFSDATFILVSSAELKPALLIKSLLKARPFLERHYKGAYETLDQLIDSDKELQRLARLENIMGAIQNNYPQIPELKAELSRFLKKVQAKTVSQDKSGAEK